MKFKVHVVVHVRLLNQSCPQHSQDSDLSADPAAKPEMSPKLANNTQGRPRACFNTELQ